MAEEIKVLWVKPEKMPKPRMIEDDYRAFQKAVGGTFQAIYPWEDPVALICNDDGKLIGMPRNRVIYEDEENETGDFEMRDPALIVDIIHGPFLIVGIKGEEFVSLSDTLYKKYEQRFRYPEKFVDFRRSVYVYRHQFE